MSTPEEHPIVRREDAPAPVSEVDEKVLPFTEHVRELRQRLIYSFVFVLIGVGVAWVFHADLFEWLMEPYRLAMIEQFPDQGQYINFRSLIEPVVVYLKTSLLVGSLAATPFVLHQLWLFVGPGLYKSEKKLAIPFMIASIIFFLGGVTFCRFIVLGPAMTVLLGFGEVNTSPTIMMEEYFSFTSRMLFVFGALFELPVVITFLTLINVVDHTWLIKQWRYVIVVAFVVGAALTPPDPMTQVALAVPLVVLYILSIGVSYLITTARGSTSDDEVSDEG